MEEYEEVESDGEWSEIDEQERSRSRSSWMVSGGLEHPGELSPQRYGAMLALFNACKNGDVDAVQLVIDRAERHLGIDLISDLIEVVRANTSLHVACYQGHVDVVRFLFDTYVGRASSLVTYDASTPLHAACAHHASDRTTGKIAVVKLLLECMQLECTGDNAKESSDDQGRTPLMVACEGGCVEIARVLIEGSADTDATDLFGHTPLMIACGSGEMGALDVVKLLLDEQGADLPRRDSAGNTPLHHAWVCDTARFLVKGGAAFDVENYAGQTALDIRGDAFDDDLRLALWRRLKLYAFGKPSKYTASAQHSVAGLQELSYHLGTFLILRPLDRVLTNREKAAVRQAVSELSWKGSGRQLRRLVESILGVPEGSLDVRGKKMATYDFLVEEWRRENEQAAAPSNV